ncbi:hypothetical protein T08_15389 [Trichinella sp. T8]|nr:hypothetical protein T08_15389 [Trichinella sp. T8]
MRKRGCWGRLIFRQSGHPQLERLSRSLAALQAVADHTSHATSPLRNPVTLPQRDHHRVHPGMQLTQVAAANQPPGDLVFLQEDGWRQVKFLKPTPDLQRPDFIKVGTQLSETALSIHTTICSQRIDLFPENLPLGNPHLDLLRCVQFPNHQGSAPAITRGGAAVTHKAQAKGADPEQPFDVAVPFVVEKVNSGVVHH